MMHGSTTATSIEFSQTIMERGRKEFAGQTTVICCAATKLTWPEGDGISRYIELEGGTWKTNGRRLKHARNHIAVMRKVFHSASIIAIFRGGHACANGSMSHINHDIRSAAAKIRRASWCCLCQPNMHPHSFALPCDLILPHLLHRFPSLDNCVLYHHVVAALSAKRCKHPQSESAHRRSLSPASTRHRLALDNR